MSPTGSGTVKWLDPKSLIRQARASDHAIGKVFFSELRDLFIFLGLNLMRINAL
jgi:hypothetical protein